MCLKSILTCSFCSKILKCPVELPCGDLICQEHLKEKEVLKQSKIKCAECKQEFDVKSNEFQSHDALRESLKGQFYLSFEEIYLINKLKDSIQKKFEIFDQN